MNTQEITNGNKLIAEFMEIEPSDTYGYFYIKESDRIEKYNQFQFKYHSSWDWLMPVVEKIEKEYNQVVITYEYCDIPNIHKSQKQNSKIEAVYIAVIEFIKWYNKNKN